MSRQPARTALVLMLLFTAPAWVNAGQDKPNQVPGEEKAKDALDKFDKNWKDYSNEPNLGDPRWKLKMEVRVRLAQAGPAALPLLEEAAKEESKWSASTREFANESLKLLRNDELRKALADYDLKQMDSARVGKAAPDFALKDATGQTHRLSQYRGQIVVLTSIIFDT